MPEITLSLPAAVGLLALFLSIGAVMVFFGLRSKPEAVIPFTPTVTATLTSTVTITPTDLPPTATSTPEPTPTPITYKVAPGETCLVIAAHYGISVEAIRQANNLSVECLLSTGQDLKIPQPTPTVTPLPTSTLSAAQQTEQACTKVDHEVGENETPNSVAAQYNVPWQAIKEENGLPGDVVYLGQSLKIPLCRRVEPAGPTATPTPPPPYPAPNLLLPADGAFFTLAEDTVTLQWAAVGTLRENEGYMVVVEHVTGGQGEKLERFVTDTKFMVPSTFRPNDRNAHIFYWWVVSVRQTGTDSEGKPSYEPAGGVSPKRSFSWSGVAAASTPSP
jgi:LysM repeat protein